jgi:pimeloyl-ACP methyl ester carboxylesterase
MMERKGMPLAKVNGIQVYYEEHGTGYPVLLIQGLGYPSGMWFRQVPELSRHFRTIVMDNRGVGKSEKPDEEYSVRLLASDVAELLQSLRIPKTHVVGVSLGGYIAQELALNDPGLVDRLVLMATSCGSPRYLELTKSLWDDIAKLAGLAPEQIIRQGMSFAVTEKFYRDHQEWIDRSVAVRMENLQPLCAFMRQSNAAMSFDSRDRAHLIRQPTLILAGAQDRVMPLVLTEELAKKVPHAQLKVFPNAAHLLFLEEADEVNRVLLDFLSGRKVEKN